MDEAVILAAGEGIRLKPFTEDMPKVMLPVANRPILEYVVNALSTAGIRRIIVVVGYKKESIMNYFGDGKKFGVNISYVNQDKQLGTGHALMQAKNYIKNDEFIVLPGDNIIDEKSLLKIIESESPSLIVAESDIPSKYGVVEMENGVITKLMEKPDKAESKLISTGIYKLRKDIFEILEIMLKKGKTMLTDSISEFIGRRKLKGIRIDGEWRDAVYPWNLLEINSYILKRIRSSIEGKIEKNVFIKGDVVIGENTIIRSGSYIEGPVIIGDNCEIGPNACIFPSTSIGNNVVVYPFSEIRNSIIMDNTTIGSSSFISNSVVGRGTEIYSHFSTIAGDSTRIVDKEVMNIDRIGSFIGSNCVIGANVVIEAGKIVGKGCRISSNNVVKDDLPDKSMVI